MGLSPSNETIDRYLQFLTRFDNEAKKKLIIKLTESLETQSIENDNSRNLFGVWEDSRSSDEIIQDIKCEGRQRSTNHSIMSSERMKSYQIFVNAIH